MMFSKKTISAVLICAVLLGAVFVLLACEKKEDGPRNSAYSAKEIADAVMALYGPEELPEAGFEHFYSGADEDSENYIEAKYAGLLIDGAYAPLEEYEYFSDCAFYVPVGRRIFEVDVLKTGPGDEKNLGALKEALERRLQTKRSSDVLTYTPEDAPLLENAKIVTVGSYVILLATTDNDKAIKAIKDMK
jgi:hypothetical protein